MTRPLLRFSTAILIAVCVLIGQGAGVVQFLHAETEAASFYVSVSGHPTGDGSIGNPWDLQTALSGPSAVRPGDTIWLRGGTYRGTFSSNLNGTASAPIKVRQYTGERAILDGGNSGGVAIFLVAGSYTWYWGFEIMSSDPIGRGFGVFTGNESAVSNPGLKFINMVVHDTKTGFGLWMHARDTEVSGCLIYYNGVPGAVAPEHGIYAQNETGYNLIRNNIVFSNASHGMQAYCAGDGGGRIDNFTVDGNTFFNNGMPGNYQRNLLVGGGVIALNPKILENVLYYPGTAGQNLNVGYDPYGAGAANPVITGNYIVNGDNVFSPLNTNVTMTGNAFYSIVNSSIPFLFPSNTYSIYSRPTTARVFVRPNQYEPGRANITVFNWGNAATVSVDLSGVLSPGATYEIRNAQNFFAPPVLNGTYDGSPVSLPMAGLSSALPAGFATPPVTGPRFNVFILLSDPAPAPRIPSPLRVSPRPVVR